MRDVPRLVAAGLVVVGCLVALHYCTGCSLLTKQTAKTALTATEIACVFNSEIVEEKTLATVCGIAKELAPLLRDLIGQREGARAAGIRWQYDAGTP